MWDQLDQPPLYSEVDVALQHVNATTLAHKFPEDNGPGKELASLPYTFACNLCFGGVD